MCTVNHFEWSCHLVAEPPGARADHRVSFPVLSWSQQRDLTRRRGRVVQARACKALYMGSIPIVASSSSRPLAVVDPHCRRRMVRKRIAAPTLTAVTAAGPGGPLT